MRRARIEDLVDAVADAHDLLFLRQLFFHPGIDFLRSPISSSIWITPSFAPPWSGPLSVPIAEVTAE